MYTPWIVRVVGIAAVAVFAARAQLPEITETALAELGIAYGVPGMSGFVFVEGRYLAPPYTVTRRGNGIFVNRVQVEQPVVWPRGVEPASAARAVDADGDFETVAPEAAQPAPAQPVAEDAQKKAVKSIDDLFADEEEPAAAPQPAAARPAPAASTQAVRSPEDHARDKAQVIEGLDRIRAGYEQALSRGEIFFFGQRHNRVNGTYGTARTLMGVLPKALRYAESPLDLQNRLKQGGVYFLDIGICGELFKNRNTFPLLEERLRKIEADEALEAMKKKAARPW
ncbi:MAG TPA: hypothetical protein PLU38_10215 [Kiritimatiellia bacterium]|nr:MAG: hypothetical protein BWX70_00314 [Verrucomicrobia bacterium ADurb.Bin070]HPB10879.1 hypothetical protein [Kiritimatiellia bacterium]HPO37831.1 hypothetical protein [Kiritimatiellia bacterium]HQA38297.1 hypothetical protein [Kiritimatiellia bacterium]HQL51443.1 hypothetical protein [Kiritimatiellia bacterium]